jgi:hypothetical protein
MFTPNAQLRSFRDRRASHIASASDPASAKGAPDTIYEPILKLSWSAFDMQRMGNNFFPSVFHTF